MTRIETDKKTDNRSNLSDNQKEKVVNLIKKTLELPSVKAVQIDFDATVSERDFYRSIVNDLKKPTSRKYTLDDDGVSFVVRRRCVVQ